MLSYIAFPPKDIILSRLRRMDGEVGEREGLFAIIAETLHSRTLDAAAFSFLLIELAHRHEDELGEEIGAFLPKCVAVLTGDHELSEAARAAFAELGPTNRS